MIPHTLQLKNFLSYGPEEQTISFTPYHLICLSGKNGHGKSAMLDAITWAIWGQARKTIGNSKADDGLMHLGQKYMFVRLDFEVNGQLYRVRREYIKTKSKPLALLDFGILKDNDSISSLTDKTIKLTQTKIEKTIGLTYESFANSAFLKQGESNSFSKKTPRERKEILATILNLHQFDLLKKSSLEKAKTIQQQHQSHLYILEKVEEEIVSLKDVFQQSKDLETKLKELLKIEQTLKGQLQKQQESSIALSKKKQERQFLEQEQKQNDQQMKELNQKIESTKKLIHVSDSKNKAEILGQLEKEKERYTKLVEHIHAQGKKEIKQKEAYFALKEKVKEQEHKNQIIAEQTKQAKISLQAQQTEHKKCAEELVKIKTEIKALEDQKKKIDLEFGSLTTIEETITEQTKKYNFLYAQGAGSNQQIQDIDKQASYFAKLKSGLDCLLCEQSVNHDQQKHILGKLEQSKKEALEKLLVTKQTVTRIQQQLKELKTEKTTTENEQSKVEQIIFKLTEYQKQEQKLLDQQSIISKQISEIEQSIKSIEDKNSTPLSENPQKQLKELESSIIAIQAERKDYRSYQEKISSIEQEIKQYHQGQQQQLEQKQLIKDLSILEKELIASTERSNKQKNALAKYAELMDEETALLEQKQSTMNQYEQLQGKKTDFLTSKGSLKTKQERQKTLAKNKVHYEEIITKLQREVSDYQAIAKALGKEGIQALLIEEALPEIEQEANKLLARLTNNQTQIFIESLRDLKKGGNKETLDIKIADNLGIRPYEMFSGGEAFRIDFALRIAISKLVARHAGTTLQTIFIDEGFGSQDEEGLQLIMDSIYKIQNDFAKVIIVSHLPSLKEQFPVQFLIQKKASGTQVTVIEQG